MAPCFEQGLLYHIIDIMPLDVVSFQQRPQVTLRSTNFPSRFLTISEYSLAMIVPSDTTQRTTTSLHTKNDGGYRCKRHFLFRRPTVMWARSGLSDAGCAGCSSR